MKTEERLKKDRRPDVGMIRNTTVNLSEMICQTKAYENYTRAWAVVQENKPLYDRFNEFRRKSLGLEVDSSETEENIEALYQEYSDVLFEPTVHRFLSAEQTMCALMRQVYDELARRVKLDLSFMDS